MTRINFCPSHHFAASPARALRVAHALASSLVAATLCCSPVALTGCGDDDDDDAGGDDYTLSLRLRVPNDERVALDAITRAEATLVIVGESEQTYPVVIEGTTIRFAEPVADPPVGKSLRLTLSAYNGASQLVLRAASEAFELGASASPTAIAMTAAFNDRPYSVGAALSTPVFGHTAASPDGKRVFVIGGASGGSLASGPTAPFSTVQVYDHITGAVCAQPGAAGCPRVADAACAKGAVCPGLPDSARRFGHTMHVTSTGRFVIAGGQRPDGQLADTVIIYNPLDDTHVETVADARLKRIAHGATLADDGTLIIAGGVTAPLNALAFPAATGVALAGLDPAAMSDEIISVGLSAPYTVSSFGQALTTKRALFSLFNLSSATARVLVTGGVDETFAALTTTEVYEPTRVVEMGNALAEPGNSGTAPTIARVAPTIVTLQDRASALMLGAAASPASDTTGFDGYASPTASSTAFGSFLAPVAPAPITSLHGRVGGLAFADQTLNVQKVFAFGGYDPATSTFAQDGIVLRLTPAVPGQGPAGTLAASTTAIGNAPQGFAYGTATRLYDGSYVIAGGVSPAGPLATVFGFAAFVAE